MSLDNPKGTESSVSKNTKQRRTFLKRATAGAAIVSIPGRSAWATVNGSVVASGHGSGSTTVGCHQILSPGSWKNKWANNWGLVPTNRPFKLAFGGNAIKSVDANGKPTEYFADTLTLSNVLNINGQGYKGPGNVNFHMVGIYLNAANHGATLGDQTINYPVLDDAHGGSLSSFGIWLYSQTLTNAEGLGATLSQMVDDYHVNTGNLCPVI
jgi:hypothetical protein